MKTIPISLITCALLYLTGCAGAAPHPLVPKDLPTPKTVPQIQVGRYTTVKGSPTKAQMNPLLAISSFRFHPSVYSVGEAVKQVLENTGYTLSTHLGAYVAETLKKPLPITHRRLDAMPIQTALEVLMGADVFRLERDPLNRVVHFKLKRGVKHG